MLESRVNQSCIAIDKILEIRKWTNWMNKREDWRLNLKIEILMNFKDGILHKRTGGQSNKSNNGNDENRND